MMTPDDAGQLSTVYRARLESELARADAELHGSSSIRSHGEPSAPLLVVKGSPGPAELGGGVVLSGADGEAWAKALTALGRDVAQAYAVLSRPVVDAPPERVAARLRRIIEACDPEWVIALDDQAADDVARSFDATPPGAGETVRLAGRSLLALDGLEASLADDDLKRRVWAQMQPLGKAAQ